MQEDTYRDINRLEKKILNLQMACENTESLNLTKVEGLVRVSIAKQMQEYE